MVYYFGADLTWEGRNLTSFDNNVDREITYQYDENGMRYHTSVKSKEDGSEITFDYVWVDGKLISTVHTENNKTKTAKYIYNDFDEPVGMLLTDEETGVRRTYYYLKNAQGDITNIVSSSGSKMVEFTYDAWGKRTIHYQADVSNPNNIIRWFEQVTACALTPFGYRGYCYDPYTDLYYLQSRYYDPNTGRFINADDTNYLNATGTVLGCNLFAYCENDGVNNVDPKGTISINKTITVLNKILKFASNVARFLLDKFQLSRKRYMTISKYKNPKSIYAFVNKNKNSIKNFRNNSGNIAKFINIVLDIIELCSNIKWNTSYFRGIAEIVFFGFIKLLTYAIPKLVTWLITTICKALKIVKSIMEDIISYILEYLLESKGYKNIVKKHYLIYLNKCSKFSFKVFVYGFFYGVKKFFVLKKIFTMIKL